MKNILRTIAYFDIYNWPLRAEEIWKWQYNNLPTGQTSEKILSLKEIFAILKTEEIKTVLQEKDGFYFLQGRENILAERTEKYLFAERKYKKVMTLARLFSFFPFIKMISICNDLGYSNAPDGSDIDLFVVSSRQRIWLTRFLITGFLKLFKMRPGENSRDAICPSFFVDEDNINLEKLALKDELGETDDPHFSYWACQISPILQKEDFNKQFGEENKWVNKFLPNASVAKELPARRCISISPITEYLEKILQGFIGDWLEKKAKKIQLKVMPENLKQLANKNTNVVITDSILKFHTHDSRENLRNKFKNL
jgi:hypothetical protein